ncbi:MAG: glycosyltransferase family 2 protein [Rhodopila sp.]|nr:glycosyltransferase family 2 protein [Rhodopila sp.]
MTLDSVSILRPRGSTLGPISVVAPAYNEMSVIREFHRRLAAVMTTLGTAWEVVYVNDGSTDATLSELLRLSGEDAHITVVSLSRNFGKEVATTAGLDHSGGGVVIVIDTDLQDPPEVIPLLVEAWREGYDVAFAQRRSRRGETWLKRTTAGLFYRIMGRVGHVALPRDTGDFRLMSRRVVDAVLTMREHHRFMKGLFAWVGFPWKAVPYDRDARHSGTTKWNYWKLAELAVEAVTSFSLFPLKVATVAGVVTALLAAGYSIFILIYTLVFGIEAPGYPSLMIAVLILGSVQLITLGVIGEYLGRVLNEAKRRPLYFVERVVKGASLSAEGASPEVHLAPPPADPQVSGDTS